MSESDGEMVLVKFHPQVWSNDRALTGDPFTFRVPREDVPTVDGELPDPAHETLDSLRCHENAPERARKWQGPFYVSVEPVEE